MEVGVLQLEDDGDVRADGDRGVGCDDRTGGDGAHGAADDRGGRRVDPHGMEAEEFASRESSEHAGAGDTATRDL